MMHYDFVRIQQTLRVTPAMAAGVTDRLWEVSDLVALLEAEERGPGKSGLKLIEERGGKQNAFSRFQR
jgi:hypothetical protein